MKNKNVIILIIALLTISFQSHACSMFAIKKNGKVMVGNNEDFWNQNSRMWFEKGNKDEFGVVYVGFDDLWPQGAINDKGLVFDGFAMPYLEIKDFEEKDSPEHEDFLQFIMRTCSKVEEVKDIFLKWDLRGMETSMFYFVDKSGKQLIVEGDFIEIRNQSYDIISNFYPSQCDNLNDVAIKYYQKGRKLIETKQDTSVSFCTSLLDSLHQESSWGGGTLYSTLYDLNEGIIYLYYNHDFDKVITINIKEELQKENQIIEIPKLFPDNKKGQEFYEKYNETISKIEELGNIKTISSAENISELEEFLNNVQKINIYREYFDKVADKWEETEDFKNAIKVYEVMAMFFPDDYQIFYKLGEANFKLKLYNKALLNYQECSKLVPENGKLKEKIDLVKESIEEQTQIFSHEKIITEGRVWDLAFEDLNKDGNTDMVIANWVKAPTIYFNDGKGGFTNLKPLACSEVEEGYYIGHAVEIADFNKDKSPDIFYVFNGRDNLIYMSDNGEFTKSDTLNTQNSDGLYISLADVDNDHDIDAFITNNKQANILWLNDGTGSFIKNNTDFGSNGYNPEFGDLNNDGNLDIICSINGAVIVWFNKGHNKYERSNQTIGYQNSFGRVKIADMDNDKDLDIVLANRNAGGSVWSNDGTGLFSETTSKLTKSSTMCVGDIDLDGKNDIILGKTIWLNNGNNQFMQQNEMQIDGSILGLWLKDIDNDTDLDLFYSTSVPENALTLIKNTTKK